MFRALGLTALLALPAAAQDLAPGLEQIGVIEATVGGEAFTAPIVYDTERQRGYAQAREIMGRVSVNAVGQVLTPQGTPGAPMFQVTFWDRDGTLDLMTAEVFDQGFDRPLVLEPEMGKGGLTAASVDGRSYTLTLEAEMQRLEGYSKGENKALDTPLVPVTMEVSFTLPEDG
ncbi:hypothetical protein ACW9UR_07830 [Halovulum sp. GXIMD14794]